MKPRRDSLRMFLPSAGVFAFALIALTSLTPAKAESGGQNRGSPPRLTAPASSAQQSSQKGGVVLRGNLKANPTPNAYVPPPVDIGALNSACAAVASGSNTQGLVTSMQQKAKQCVNKTYSAQDQMAAGCSGSDTVDQCAKKLYQRCLYLPPNPTTATYAQELEKKLSSAVTCANHIESYKNYLNYVYRYNFYYK